MNAPPRSLIALAASVVLCAVAHLLLRHSAAGGGAPLELALRPGVWLGLGIYGSGTLLWILCLRRLDLSFAHPASALQLVLVYAGAATFLGETIPPLRLVGAGVILLGIAMLYLERRASHANA